MSRSQLLSPNHGASWARSCSRIPLSDSSSTLPPRPLFLPRMHLRGLWPSLFALGPAGPHQGTRHAKTGDYGPSGLSAKSLENPRPPQVFNFLLVSKRLSSSLEGHPEKTKRCEKQQPKLFKAWWTGGQFPPNL